MQRKYNFNDLSSESDEGEENLSSSSQAEEVQEDEIYEVAEGQAERVQQILTTDIDEPSEQQFLPDMENLVGLVPVKRAYDFLESFPTESPMLSIDHVCADVATPGTFFFLGGTCPQTSLEKPSVQLLRLTDIETEQQDSSSEAENSVNNLSQPVFERRLFDVEAGVLRVKSATSFLNNQFATGCPSQAAAWLSNGTLAFYDLQKCFKQFGQLQPNQLPHSSFAEPVESFSPVTKQFKFQLPGYGLDFSTQLNLFASGSQANDLNVFKLSQAGVLKDPTNYSKFAAGSSIEDVRFGHIGSAVSAGLFAASSTGGYVQIVDPRLQNQMQPVKYSQDDINVIDFDYADEHMLYAGDDAGQVMAIDIRSPAQPERVIQFNKGPITSLKASPTAPNTILVSDDKGAVVFYCFDSENDPDLIKIGYPSEFLFLHCGVEEPREVTFCGRSDGWAAVTDLNGIQLLRPKNL